MRFISTLSFLLAFSLAYSQVPLPCKVGEKINDTTNSSITNGLTGKVHDLNVQTVSQGRMMSCLGSRMPRNSNPLLVVDGEIWTLNRISSLVPNDIKSVEVLKSSVATAIYGPDGVNGALIITLKRPASTVMMVRDNLDKSAISKATVTFVIPVRNDTLRYVADDSGRIVTNSARELVGCRMIVSAVGYKAETRVWSEDMVTREHEILLSRDVKGCDEVVLSSTVCWGRMIRCGYSIKYSRGRLEEHSAPVEMKVYPNPARRGEQVSIVFNAETTETVRIQVLNAGANILQTETKKPVKGNNRIIVNTNPAWSAGIYFIQVMYENGRVAASEKIIIQQ